MKYRVVWGATIPRAINSQGKPFTLQPRSAHKELKFFDFGGEATMFGMGEDEIRPSTLTFHEGRVDACLRFVVEDDAADGTALRARFQPPQPDIR
jgi:hypothetical protein